MWDTCGKLKPLSPASWVRDNPQEGPQTALQEIAPSSPGPWPASHGHFHMYWLRESVCYGIMEPESINVLGGSYHAHTLLVPPVPGEEGLWPALGESEQGHTPHFPLHVRGVVGISPSFSFPHLSYHLIDVLYVFSTKFLQHLVKKVPQTLGHHGIQLCGSTYMQIP